MPPTHREPSEALSAWLGAAAVATDHCIVTTDAEGRISSWSDTAARIFGYAAGDMVGRLWRELLADGQDAVENDVAAQAAHGEIVRGICETVRCGDGARCPVVLSVIPVRGAGGEVIGAVRAVTLATSPDSEWRAARRLAAIVESTDDAIVAKDLNGTVTSWNRAAELMFGYTASEMIGQSIRRIIPADRQSEEDDVLARMRRGERVRHFETVRVRKDGTLVPISLTLSPLRDDSGRVVGASKVARDIRDQKRLSAIVDSSDDAIISKTLDGIVTSWNRAAEQMFGYTPEEIIGRSIRTIIPADRQSEEDDVLARIRSGQKVDHFETIRQRKDGSLVPISLTVSPVRDDRGTVVGASKIARDVSDRVRADEERTRLLAIAERNASITTKLNHVGTIVASTLDRAAVVQAVTDAATDLTTAQFGAFFYNAVDDRGEAYTLYTISGVPRDAFDKFPMPRNTAVFEPTFRGTGIVRSADITKDPRYGRNAPYHGQPPGHLPVRSYLAVPVRSASGDVLGGLFFGHERTGHFTAEHEALAVGIASWASVALENARLYRGLQEANRLKDEFLATLSHELRTPLNAILGYARMLRTGHLAPEKMPRAVETIERNATSLTQIVEDVLDVSRIVAGKLRLNVQPMDVADVVRRAIEATAPAADAKGIQLRHLLATDVGPVSGDAERLQQIVWNLLSNAVKFTNRGGRIEVRVERVHSSIAIVVSDTGVGIAPQFVPHLFERFRQADGGMARARGGLGLGLSIARQLVEMHGGTITGASEGEGKGSTFTVMLPIMAAGPLAASAESDGDVVVPMSAKDLTGVSVLAVDDDPDSLTMVRDILEDSGATVRTASSADAALRSMEERTPDVLVADLGMPYVDGFDLIARVRRHDSAAVARVPAAALTAYARSEDRTRALRAGFQLHLAKPINPPELVESVLSLSRHR